MKNLYQQLQPKYKKVLNENVKRYQSVQLIKYTLMSKTMWSQLTVENVKDLMLWAGIDARKMTIDSLCYGENIIK